MRIHCPICSTAIDITAAHIGQKGRCASCESKFIIPDDPDGEFQILERGQSSVAEGPAKVAAAFAPKTPPAKPAANFAAAPTSKTGPPKIPVAPATKKTPKIATPKAPASFAKKPAAATAKPKAPATAKAATTSLAKPSKEPSADEKKPALRTDTGTTLSVLDLRVKANQAKRGSPAKPIIIATVGLLSLIVVVAIAMRGGGDGDQKLAAAEEPELELPKPPPPEVEEKPEPEPEPAPVVAANDWEQVIHPLLDKHCNGCHDEVREEGGVDFDRFASEREAMGDPGLWETAAALIEMHEMPPRKKRKQPKPEEREQLISWIKTVSERWDAGEFGRDPGRTTIRRLNKNEYNYTARDLFGLKLRPADDFPEDGGGEAGFDNNADALFLPPLLMENYVESAGIIVHTVYRNQSAYQKYLFAFPGGEVKPKEAARKVLSYWASRAYRRPAAEEEVDRLVKIFELGVEKKKQDYKKAMQMPLLAILISPNFLYRAEKVQPGNNAYKVDDFDLASRLSYFLWSSTPDDELFGLARGGKLGDPQVIEAQVKRMLVDEKAKSLSMHFAGQWFKWEELRSRTNPDRKRFPSFDFELRVSMYQESSNYFENLLRDNGRILELIDSDYTYLNPRLARHYGIEGVDGVGFRKVSLKDPNRGGVIGMGSVLAATSLPLRSSPSVRGNYVLTELLGTPPPSPPMNVPQLPEDDRAIQRGTFREELSDHAFIPDCKACHERIDPLGFGLENFDAIGRWRTQANGKPLDTQGVLPDGTAFSSPATLKKVLMDKRDLFTRNMVRKTLSYGLGRELSPYDRQVVKSITDKVIAADYRIQTLFVEVARSYPFLHCRGDVFTPQ